VVLDDLVPADHVCRVIDAFVEKLAMSDLGFERAQGADTGRPGYDPRDLFQSIGALFTLILLPFSYLAA
jgi:transposase